MTFEGSKFSASWVCSSFDNKCNSEKLESIAEFTCSKPTTPQKMVQLEMKKKSLNYKSRLKQKDEIPWIEKFVPCSKDELAVHKKKISEVEAWLVASVQRCQKKENQKAPMLLLTGSTGSGKTATVQALCKDLKLDVHEWTNSHQENYWKSQYDDFSVHNELKDVIYQNQSSLFSSFLLRSNKYSLFSNLQRIVLVEDFPNVFLKDSIVFHNILRKYHESAKSPIIFITSDNTRGESIENRLFPKPLQLELSISCISFNPVAPTMLMKILNKINNSIREGSSHMKLSKTQLEEIASGCAGDLRNAINAFQFFSMSQSKNQQHRLPFPKKRKHGVLKNSDEAETMAHDRDSSLFLFHALGKILYCKRGASQNENSSLPQHLKHLERVPLISNPEEVYERTSISAEGFSLFLHQNYISFIEDIKVAADCSFWLSQSEVLTVQWNDRDVMNDYVASLTARGLMFNLTPSSLSNRWRPLHKPQFYSNRKHRNSLNDTLRHTFKEKSLSLKELQLEFIPYLFKIGTQGLPPNQAALTAQLGEMSVKRSNRPQYESLDVKDPFEVDASEHFFESTQSVSPPKIPITLDQETSDEEIVIEEYDF